MPLMGTFTFYLRRRAQVKTRTVSIQLPHGQQVPITWFRFLSQAKLRQFFIFQKTFSKTNDWWVKQLPTWSLEIFFTGKNSDNFSYFRKHFLKQMIDESLESLEIFSSSSSHHHYQNWWGFQLDLWLTPCWRLEFLSILITLSSTWSVVTTLLKVQKMVSIFAGSVVNTLLKAQKWWWF